MSTFKVTVMKDGPYVVSGGVPLAKQHIVTNAEGESLDWREGDKFPDAAQYALCRCGHSAKKPFCDGTHRKVSFDGTETASREPYASRAEVTDGPSLTLSDEQSLCAFGRFCDPHGQVWSLVTQEGDQARKWTIAEAGHCPAGRLVVTDKKTGQPIEPNLPQSIGLVEDTAQKVSGPIWVRGGIPVVAADGAQYEVRNRVTLCRCGASSNKPFCDGSHASIKFTDAK
ncbi:MAG TPA: CDGSH iron-sulfur domain-containing protein [Polyangia bacterium]|nr:CDGSH iron-sulfur domain-containing protein [Polyangia bacterium]